MKELTPRAKRAIEQAKSFPGKSSLTGEGYAGVDYLLLAIVYYDSEVCEWLKSKGVTGKSISEQFKIELPEPLKTETVAVTPRKRWEYLTMEIQNMPNCLGRSGEGGWELVGIVKSDSIPGVTDMERVIGYFKRELQ